MQRISGVASLPRANGYSHAVVATGTAVWISGQVPLRADGTLVGGDDVAVQTEQVFRNLGSALAAAGASWSAVVKLTYFVLDAGDVPRIREVRDRFLPGDSLPASSLVQVAALVDPRFRIEIDAIAVLEQGRPEQQ